MKFLLFASICSAHYVLTVPQPRGTDELKQLDGPCSDYPVSNKRADLSIKSPITIKSYHNDALMKVYVSFKENPKNQSDFLKLDQEIKVKSLGEIVTPALTFCQFKEAQPGTKAVLQTVFEGPDGQLFQCADVTFVKGSEACEYTPQASQTTKSSASGTTVSALGSAILMLVNWYL